MIPSYRSRQFALVNVESCQVFSSVSVSDLDPDRLGAMNGDVGTWEQHIHFSVDLAVPLLRGA